MRLSHLLIRTLLFLIFPISANTQSWLWAKKSLVIDNINTLPQKTCIDSRGNTLLLSLKQDRFILSKHDINGTMLWKRELFLVTIGNSNLSTLCVDELDNIYLATGAMNKIDNIVINTPSPYGLLKFNSSGRYIWGRTINYAPLVFAPTLINSGNRIFMALRMEPFGNLTYNNTVYNNIGGNTKCSFIASLDTSGMVQWYKRIYSPPQPLACNPRDVFPSMTVNAGKDLFLSGEVTNKLMGDGIAIIDKPYTCKYYQYGLLINGNTGQVKWAKELEIDTLAPKPNMSLIQQPVMATVLSNGYSVLYKYTTRDTALGSFTYKTDGILNMLYLYDTAGNFIRKDSLGKVETGWHRILQLIAGDATSFYCSGLYTEPFDGIKTYEAKKWDTLLHPIWEKRTEYNDLVPYFSSTSLYYRNKMLNMTLENGSGSNLIYAYFGADSLLPTGNRQFVRMLDSSNFISGTVFFDQNLNGIKDATEPPAPGVLISDNSGNRIYASTNNAGYYEASVTPGTYTLKPLNLAVAYPNHTNVNPTNYSVVISGYGSYLRNKNFGLRVSSPVNDGQVNITAYTIARPGGTLWFKTQVSNPGTSPFNGTYKISYDTARLSYISSIHPPTTITPPQLTYTISGTNPASTVFNDISFSVKTTVVAGDTIKVKAELLTTPSDGLPINNTDSIFRIVRTSFDPNNKEVYPFKDVKYDSVTAGRQELDYTIHFQNTGTDTAFAVLIADTLDTKLDISSFHIVASSHPVIVRWNGSVIAGFYFPNILLPDSTTNQVKSNGFIRFKIRPKTSVLLSDIVKNDASIYFDYAAPVKTNTVTSNFVTSVVTGINNITTTDKNLDVWPRPAKEEIRYRVIANSFNELTNVSIYDNQGRLVLSRSERIIGQQTYHLNVSRLSMGIYYLIINTRQKKFVQQIVID